MGSLERFGVALDGRALVLGVRPQDVFVAPTPPNGALAATGELIQLVGSEKLLDLALPAGVAYPPRRLITATFIGK